MKNWYLWNNIKNNLHIYQVSDFMFVWGLYKYENWHDSTHCKKPWRSIDDAAIAHT
jgi:hypothetical protein